jgi:hypothetical protein
MLRYFGGVSSYEQIAALCGVPVGTVRSRLNQAKLKLADALLATASGAHPNAGVRTTNRRREVVEFFALAEQGDGEHAANAMFWPDVEIITPWGEAFHGQEALVRGHAMDCEAGVRLRLTDVIAGHVLTVVEGVFLNPADDPTHCPPSVMMVHFLREGRIRRMRYFHQSQVLNPVVKGLSRATCPGKGLHHPSCVVAVRVSRQVRPAMR